MSSSITATDILELLTKAEELGASYNIKRHEDRFEIGFYYPWEGDDDAAYWLGIIISNNNDSTVTNISNNTRGCAVFGFAVFEFSAMMYILNDRLKKQKLKRTQAQRRKELIESLTPEQRELLGV